MAKLIVSVDDKLHQAFRIKCLTERRSMKDKITEYIMNEVGKQVLEMDKETLQAFLTGKKEIQRGEFITLSEAKNKFEIK
jgi:hypothetical protein